MSDSDWAEFQKQVLLAEKILLIFITIPTIIGNTLVLLATWKERSLHQPNKYFIVCLAVADLLVGTLIGPARVYGLSADAEARRDISVHVCRLMVWIDTFALTASVYTLMFISFDRYIKISKPLQYRSRMTTSRSLKIIFIIWLVSIAFATYSATPDTGSYGFLASGAFLCPHYRTSTSKLKGYFTFVYMSVIFLPAIVIIIMYAFIFVVAHKRQKMWRDGELGEIRIGQNQRRVTLRQDLKTVRMLLIVVGVFLFCWFPLSISLILSIYNTFKDWSRKSFHIYIRVMFLLPLINSVMNPIIYGCLDQTYRKAFKRLFQKMMCRKRSNTQQPPAVIELHPPSA